MAKEPLLIVGQWSVLHFPFTFEGLKPVHACACLRGSVIWFIVISQMVIITLKYTLRHHHLWFKYRIQYRRRCEAICHSPKMIHGKILINILGISWFVGHRWRWLSSDIFFHVCIFLTPSPKSLIWWMENHYFRKQIAMLSALWPMIISWINKNQTVSFCFALPVPYFVAKNRWKFRMRFANENGLRTSHETSLHTSIRPHLPFCSSCNQKFLFHSSLSGCIVTGNADLLWSVQLTA